MDPISHAVIGSAVAAFLPPGTPPSVAMGVVLGAEIPDIDFMLKYFGGQITYLKNHRGPTHGLLVLPLHAAVIAGILLFLFRDASFWTLFWWTLAGSLSHVIFDCGNDYGTKGLWPFSSRYIALDIIPIVDLGLLALIGGGWLVNLVWPGHRGAVFATVWLTMLGYVALRWFLRRRAFGLVASQFDLSQSCGDAAPCGPRWQEERLTIHPSLLSLNAWRYTLQMPGEFFVGMVRVWEGKVGEPRRARNQYDMIVKASLKSQIVSSFADWVRRPRAEVLRKENLYQVRWTDMRYEVDGFSPFTAYAWLDDQLTLVDDGLGRQGPDTVEEGAIKRRLRQEMGKERS